MLKLFFGRVTMLTILLVSSLSGFAQSDGSGMDNAMRSHDKIYVVMAVCLTILIVMILYLIRIDLKISKKEKND